MKKIKKGDTVLVIKGKDRGKTGKVEKIIPKTRKLIVSGVNIYKKHLRPSRKNPHGGIISFPLPIYVSKVMVICSACNKPTRVGFKLVGTEKIRICSVCHQGLEKKEG